MFSFLVSKLKLHQHSSCLLLMPCRKFVGVNTRLFIVFVQTFVERNCRLSSVQRWVNISTAYSHTILLATDSPWTRGPFVVIFIDVAAASDHPGWPLMKIANFYLFFPACFDRFQPFSPAPAARIVTPRTTTRPCENNTRNAEIFLDSWALLYYPLNKKIYWVSK